jgi:hypothetical protein
MPKVLSSSAAVSYALRMPSGPPTALTWISRKSSGRPMPPTPETLPGWPRPLSPAVSVMFRPVTSMLLGVPGPQSRSYASTHVGSSSVSMMPASSSASRIFRGERSVTSAEIVARAHAVPTAPVHCPVAWMWPTRRSPLPLCSTTVMFPFVSTSILPEPSVRPRLTEVSSSVHVASTSVYARTVISVAADGC